MYNPPIEYPKYPSLILTIIEVFEFKFHIIHWGKSMRRGAAPAKFPKIIFEP